MTTKSDVVTNAVLDQLTSEGRPIEDLAKVLSKAPKAYTDLTLPGCLAGIQDRILNTRGDATYAFQYDDTFVADTLSGSIDDLIDAVFEHTT